MAASSRADGADAFGDLVLPVGGWLSATASAHHFNAAPENRLTVRMRGNGRGHACTPATQDAPAGRPAAGHEQVIREQTAGEVSMAQGRLKPM
jgi:hypothetical protein